MREITTPDELREIAQSLVPDGCHRMMRLATYLTTHPPELWERMESYVRSCESLGYAEDGQPAYVCHECVVPARHDPDCTRGQILADLDKAKKGEGE